MEQTKILLIQHESRIIKNLREILAELGYAFSETMDSTRKALAYAKKEKPDLILADVHLEQALEGIRVVQALQTACCSPVIYLTSKLDKEALEFAKKTQPANFLVYPVKPKELEIAIELALVNSF